MDLNADSRLRIAQVCDGFPHYVHLITEKLLWIAFRSEEEVTTLTPEHYIEAINNALLGVEARLREIYDQAVKMEDDEYQEILWSIADHFELERNIKSIYSNSYERIMSDCGRAALPYEKFNGHIRALRSAKHGSIVKSIRPGWIGFTENLVRGYVRLKAESQGVRLALEHEPSPDPKYMWKKNASQGRAKNLPFPKYSWGKPRG